MDWVNMLLKFLTITSVSFLTFKKIIPINFKPAMKILLGVGFIFLISTTWFIADYFVDEPFRTMIVIAFSSVLLTMFTRERFEITLTTFIIIYAASYLLYGLSLIISALIMYPFAVEKESVYHNIIACTITISVVVLLLKTKINFNAIFKKFASGIFLSISAMTFILYSLAREDISDKGLYFMMAGFVALGFGIYSWVRRETTIARNEDANEVIKNKLEGIIAEKEKHHAAFKEAYDIMASKDHKNNKQWDALQRTIEKIAMASQQPDILADAQMLLEEIKISRSKDNAELSKNLVKNKTLPLTRLQLVDNKFEMMLERASVRKIDFDLKVNGDVRGMDDVIPQLELVNIIGDLAENAFIAIKHLGKDDIYRSVLFSIAKVDDIFELSANDSGIPFEIDTLINLGMNRVTTHAEDGGSGYGYETIFECVKNYGASLFITEYELVPFTYSKNITLRFDGRGCYTVKSFRADTISKQNTNKDLTILNLKG